MKVTPTSTVVLAVLLLLAGVTGTEAQPRSIPRVGVLDAQVLAGSDDAFREGLRQLGYVEGKNIAIEWRKAGGAADRFPELAAELVRLNVDVIVAANNPAVAAAQRATTSIPIVMVLPTDPVGLGFVASLGRPSGNTTGLTLQTPELAGKRLELLRDAVPGLRRVAILWDSSEPGRRALVDEAQLAAPRLRLQLHAFDVRSARDIDGAFAAMTRDRFGAVLVYGSSMLANRRAAVADLAARSRVPAMCVTREWMDAGFMMSYGPSLQDMYRRAPYFVDKILKGTKPADLPVEQPIKFELVINARTTRALGLSLPPSLLLRADHVID